MKVWTKNLKLKIEKILEKYSIKKPFVVYTGSLYPHKNVESLVQAVKCFNDLNHDNKKLTLVIVCARNIFYDRFLEKVKKLKAQDLVNLVGFVPDEEIGSLYSQAEAFVFPSFWEGFGLPGLEAMGLGLPVLAARASCLPEVYGEAALYFDPHQTTDLVKKIKKIKEDKKLREELIKKGLAQVKKYSWGKTAKETLKVYQSLHKP